MSPTVMIFSGIRSLTPLEVICEKFSLLAAFFADAGSYGTRSLHRIVVNSI